MPANPARTIREKAMNADNPLPPDAAAAAAQLDELIGLFEQHPDPAVQERVVALLRCVDRLHRGGLRRLAELLRLSGLEQPALADPEVRLLFDLYELGEGGERQRAESVLESVQNDVEAHGGRLEVVNARSGVITVRLGGVCQSSAAALQAIIEQTLRQGLTDFLRLEIQEPPPVAGALLQLGILQRGETNAPK